MSQASPQSQPPSSSSGTSAKSKIWRDAQLLLSVFVACLLMVAFISYSPLDDAWSVVHSNAPKTAQNAIGQFGAGVADVFFQLLGVVAYSLPLLILLATWRRFRGVTPMYPLGLKSLSLLVGLLSACALSDLTVFSPSFLPAGTGGIIGSASNAWSVAFLGILGSSLLWICLLSIATMVLFEYSWLNVFERVGVLVSALGAFVYGALFAKENSDSDAIKQQATTRTERSDGAEKSSFFSSVFAHVRTPKSEPIKRADPPVMPDMNVDDIAIGQDDFDDIDLPPFEPDAPIVAPKPVAPKTTVSTPATAPVNSAVDSASKRTKKAEATPKAVEPEAGIRIEPLEKHDTGVSQRVQKESQKSLFSGLSPLPPISLLDPAQEQTAGFSEQRLQELSELLVRKLADFNVKVEVTAIAPGPVITRFEIQPAPGVKASKITNLAKDLARSMAMISVRVVEVIPGKSVMGIEVPNEDRAIVRLSEVLSSKVYDESKSPLTLAMGHDIGGNPVITDLAKAPHMLVAGTTGSGKSVGVNAMLLSMLLKATPEELKMILIDPKMLELSVYEGIPHLLTPVITDMKQAANGLRWSVDEMERRYQLMAAMGVRNIAGFNKKIRDANERGEPIMDPLWQIDQSFNTTPPTLQPLPYIVVVIDEFADMMMMVGKKVEELIARIAQKARAAGIHLVLATQRPSVDVITGLIKANIPTRVAFQVSSKIDSRTILDQGGADQLLGHGDMLFLPPGNALPERVHGAYVADDEVHRVVSEWKLRGEPQYEESITQAIESGEGGAGGAVEGGDEQDELYDLAVAFVLESGKCSISSVQRKLRIGYNRAARLVETMEASGVVSAPGHNGAREILAPNHGAD